MNITRIKINFVEAVNYTFESKWFYQWYIDAMNKAGEELKQILIDDYFNGADMAVSYLGYSLDNEYFEFDLNPN